MPLPAATGASSGEAACISLKRDFRRRRFPRSNDYSGPRDRRLILAVCVGAWTDWSDNERSKEKLSSKIPPAKAAPGTESTRCTGPQRGRMPAPVRASLRTPVDALADEEDRAARGTIRRNCTILPKSAGRDRNRAGSVVSRASKRRRRMPLPNAVIARTIGRIGYPCGQVASDDRDGRRVRALQGDLHVRTFLPRRAGSRTLSLRRLG